VAVDLTGDDTDEEPAVAATATAAAAAPSRKRKAAAPAAAPWSRKSVPTRKAARKSVPTRSPQPPQQRFAIRRNAHITIEEFDQEEDYVDCYGPEIQAAEEVRTSTGACADMSTGT
jgi:hypothetical protein